MITCYDIWASAWDFQQCGMCDQQSLRSACAYVQSDQSLSQWLEYAMSVKLLTDHPLEFLSLKGGCRGPSESTHVKMPHCWKSYALAHMWTGKSTNLRNLSISVNVLNFQTLYSFFSNKIMVFRTGIHKMLYRTTNREDPKQTASMKQSVLGLHFWQAIRA